MECKIQNSLDKDEDGYENRGRILIYCRCTFNLDRPLSTHTNCVVLKKGGLVLIGCVFFLPVDGGGLQ